MTYARLPGVCFRRMAMAPILSLLASGLLIAAQAVKQRFDVSSDAAEISLKKFSEQSGLEVLFPTGAARAVRTNAIKGEFTPLEALNRMVSGTGLMVREDEKSGAIAITPMPGSKANKIRPEPRKSSAGRTHDPSKENAIESLQAKPPMKRNRFVAVLATAFSLSAAPSEAQLARGGSSPAVAESDETVELSPFVVNAAKDEGYRAQNTLAGSRMNTSLKDTAATISVFTSEFINDLGATTLEDIAAYSINTVVELGEHDAGGTANGVAEFHTQLKVRGLDAEMARNYFSWKIPTDTFNVDRIDESRGPNSILFGLGSAGGILNTTTKRAGTQRTFGSVDLKLGSWDLFRVGLDYNRPLVKDVFALRLNGLWSRQNDWREYEYKDQERVHLTTTYRPFERSVIRAEYEAGNVEDLVSRPWTSRDYVSTWLGAGRPLIADTNVANNSDRPNGIIGVGNAARMVYVEGSGAIMNWQNMLTTALPAGVFNSQILDESVIPRSANIMGPGAIRDTDYSTYSVYWEQNVNKAIDFEVAYNHQEYDFIGYDPNNDAIRLYGDPNQYLPTNTLTGATANPSAGRIYAEGAWFRRTRSEKSDQVRATLSYELEAGKWGSHRLAGMYEREESRFQRASDREYLINPSASPLVPAANNSYLVYRRHYIDEADPKSYRVPDWRESAIGAFTDPVRLGSAGTPGRSYPGSHWIPANSNVDDDKESIDSMLLSMQNFFLKGRLVTTFGYRKDTVENHNRGAKLNDQGVWVVDYDSVTETEIEASTRTRGLVAHAFPWLSFFYNDSSSIDRPNNAHRILPHSGSAGTGRGEGEDYGIKLDLLDGKVFVNYVVYKSADTNNTANASVNGFSQMNTRVLGALRDAGHITQADVDARTVTANAGSFDSVSDGWEVSVTANPMRGWRVSAGYSKTFTSESNMYPEVRKWGEENIAYWTSFGPGALALSTSAAETIETEIAEFYRSVGVDTILEGFAKQGLRKHKCNLFTKYTFQGGPLKNFSIGGGYRYQSANALARAEDGRVIYGNENELLDAVLGYRFKLGDKINLSLQLNVFNLLDEDRVNIGRVFPGSGREPQSIILPEPRSWRLSARFSF